MSQNHYMFQNVLQNNEMFENEIKNQQKVNEIQEYRFNVLSVNYGPNYGLELALPDMIKI